MENTTNLKLPLLIPNQSGKEITHNEALVIIDNILQNGVIDKDLSTPPVEPNNNDVYIVGNNATNEWQDKEKQIAFYDNGWRFIKPREGFIFWINDEDKLYTYNGINWIETIANAGGGTSNVAELNDLTDVEIASPTVSDILQYDGTNFVNTKSIQNVSSFGINTAADTSNKLSVKSDYVLFDKATDSSRVKVNKNTLTDTASHLFQTNYSGRAEFGLIGSDDFTLKVSNDGETWNESFKVDNANGNIDFKKQLTINNLELSIFKKETINLNNETQIIFTDLDDGYNHIFDFINVASSYNEVSLLINLSIDGINYDKSSNYQYSAIGQTRTGSKSIGTYPFMFSSCNGYNDDNTDNAFRLAQTTYSESKNSFNLSNKNDIVYNATIEFINPSTSTGNKVISYKEIFRQNNGTSLCLNGQGTWTKNSSYKAVKFIFTNGNFASGIIKHYIKK